MKGSGDQNKAQPRRAESVLPIQVRRTMCERLLAGACMATNFALRAPRFEQCGKQDERTTGEFIGGQGLAAYQCGGQDSGEQFDDHDD